MTMTIPSDMPPASKTNPRPSRRVARQLALQLLFQYEFQEPDSSWQERFWSSQATTGEIRIFASRLVLGVIAHQLEIDRIIRHFAVDWSLERMPVVDRNVLRCSIYELLWEPDIPAMVTINEAVELAKRFADDESRRFVNGILDHIFRDEPRLAIKRRQVSSKPEFSGPISPA